MDTRKWLWPRRLLGLVAVSALVAACSGSATTEATTAASAAASAVANSGSAAASAAPAASSAQLTKVTLQLQWVTQAQFAGYYAALAQGYYKDMGLDVTIKAGGPDIVGEQVVAAGQADFGISPLVRTLSARGNGADLVSIAEMIQQTPGMEVSFKSAGITSAADLKGKKVGTWGNGNEAELYAMLRKAGVDPTKDITVVKQGFDMSQLLNGDVDAAQANVYNEYAQLLETKNPKTGQLYTPDDFNELKYSDALDGGQLQDQIFTTQKWLSTPGNEDVAVRFLEASFKGWAYCRDNRDSCVQTVLQAGSQLGQSHQTWMMNEVNALIWPAATGIGIAPQAAFDRTVQIALTYKLLKAAPDAGAWRTDLAQKADDALKAAGVDVNGSGFAKGTVTLQPGGN